MTSLNYAMTYANDQVRQGKINVDQANVLIVQMMGVRVIEGKIPAQIRKALNAAVKAGELGHIKKDGLKPEAYHHKNARATALDKINEIYRNKIDILGKVHLKKSEVNEWRE